MNISEYLLQKYPSKDKFIKEIYSVFDKKRDYYLTTFLNFEEQDILENIYLLFPNYYLYKSEENISLERKRYVISSIMLNDIDFNIKIYKIIHKNKFISLKHKMIKGTLYNIGIDENLIGDIIDTDDGFYFSCDSKLNFFIENNFSKIDKEKITLENKDEFYNKKKGVITNIIIPSKRLDVIISNSLNISRSKANKLIESSLVKVNNKTIEKSSYICDNNEVIISIRGHGRIILKEYLNMTSKNKYVTQVEILK